MSATASHATTILFRPEGADLPSDVAGWLDQLATSVISVQSGDELMALTLRGRPRLVVFDGRKSASACVDACRRLKTDSYTGVIPAVMLVTNGQLRDAFIAGADEVLEPGLTQQVVHTRLDAVLVRSDRDLGVHPSTRLPGAGAIEAEIRRRIGTGEIFAVCYADLDHFKEFNDRYSYNQGDRVIRILAMILHDIVKGMCGETGFIGHIGGDDFIFIIPYDAVNDSCEEIISIFDTLIPLQYSETDRRAGYFFGKDRRGVLDRVPLMTVSIGVVSNAMRPLKDARQISLLATEMKTYAKTLHGSVFSIDRRTDERPPVYDTRHPSIHDAAGENE
ncbi:MAG TPA: GGDEF domain-containing protein [Gemmatimonadaceae bacterium]|nr:GGDEF domain-containing protein [Gemmatimonadaceae bacterium]